MKTIPAVLLGLAAGFTAGWFVRPMVSNAPVDDFTTRRVALLESEVARLSGLLEQRRKEAQAPNLAVARGKIERAVEEIRGLKFLEPVRYDMLTRDAISEVLRQKLDEQVSAAEFQGIALGFTALGLLEPGYPLRQKYIDLLSEQVAAFYDQHTHTLHMFEDAALDNAQNQVVLAHELMHALQDQHFSLKKLPLEIKHNDDLAFAASALVEGEATVVMSEFLLRNLSWGTVRDSLAGMIFQNMAQLQTAPPILREMLLFPYLRGQEFCLMLQAQGGYDALTAAYRNPPASTAQILHPELYFSRVDPVRVEWKQTTLNGAQPAADNVLGEMGTRILLGGALPPADAERAADGWAGDRYAVFGNEAEWHLIWKTLWRTPEDAGEFAAALEKSRPQVPGRTSRIQRDGNTVLLIDAVSASWADALQTL